MDEKFGIEWTISMQSGRNWGELVVFGVVR